MNIKTLIGRLRRRFGDRDACGICGFPVPFDMQYCTVSGAPDQRYCSHLCERTGARLARWAARR